MQRISYEEQRRVLAVVPINSFVRVKRIQSNVYYARVYEPSGRKTHKTDTRMWPARIEYVLVSGQVQHNRDEDGDPAYDDIVFPDDTVTEIVACDEPTVNRSELADETSSDETTTSSDETSDDETDRRDARRSVARRVAQRRQRLPDLEHHRRRFPRVEREERAREPMQVLRVEDEAHSGPQQFRLDVPDDDHDAEQQRLAVERDAEERLPQRVRRVQDGVDDHALHPFDVDPDDDHDAVEERVGVERDAEERLPQRVRRVQDGVDDHALHPFDVDADDDHDAVQERVGVERDAEERLPQRVRRVQDGVDDDHDLADVHPADAAPVPVNLDDVVENVLRFHTCPYCNSSLFGQERSPCCYLGRHILNEEDRVVPQPFREFYERYGDLLRENCREINQLCSMTVIGVDCVDRSRGGVSLNYEERAAEICGRVFHFQRDAAEGRSGHPLLGSSRSFLYAETRNVEPSERYNNDVINAALEFRLLLREHNHFVRDWQLEQGHTEMTLEQLRVEFEDGEGVESHVPQIMLLYSVNGDIFSRPHTYAALMDRDEGLRKAWTNTQSGYERSAYALLDPAGVSGWFHAFDHRDYSVDGFKDRSGHRLSLLEYTRCKMHQSEIVRFCPRLTEEWLLDQMSRMAELNQRIIVTLMRRRPHITHPVQPLPQFQQMRRTTVAEFQRNAGDFDTLGKLMKIPASIRGSPRYRSEHVAKGMALVYTMGAPTVFLTMTANPEWADVRRALRNGCKWYQDPHTVNRIFKQKLEAFLDNLRAGKYFGGRTPDYIQYCIEFQKRGLPHCHCLVRLSGNQPSTPAAVDEIVSCSIPERCDEACGQCGKCRLRKAVLEHMVHRCYPARCFKKKRHEQRRDTDEKKCNYHFPFKPQQQSSLGERGRWLLRRQPGEERIVGYNPQLLLEFDCHFNVDIASSSRCVFYLRKYFNKAPDQAAARLVKKERTLDEEMGLFYKARCMTSNEAAWEMSGWPFQFFEPNVEPLQLYTPGMQPVFFSPGRVERVDLSKTTSDVEIYFRRPTGPAYDNVRFNEYFEMFTFGRGRRGDDDTCIPVHRIVNRRERCVCFVSNLNYSNAEQFALFLLLQQFPARSYEELRFGEQTFAAAAGKKGLLANNGMAVHNAIFEDMRRRHFDPFQVRLFFSTLAVLETADCASLEELFFKHYASMTELYSLNHRHLQLDALRRIEELLLAEGITLSGIFSAPSPQLKELLDVLDVDVEQRAADFLSSRSEENLDEEPNISFTDRQQEIINMDHTFTYINGFAGCGKTTTLRALYRRYTLMNKVVLCSAFTGMASSLLPSAVTTHRLFGLPVEESDPDKNSVSTIGYRSLAGALLRKADVLLIDEVSMLHGNFMPIIDLTLREVCRSTRPFAGKVVILAGDFAQLPPIVHGSHGQQASTVDASIVSSELFRLFTVTQLTENCRFVRPEYAVFTQHVALGTPPTSTTRINGEVDGEEEVELPPNITIVKTVAEAQRLLHQRGVHLEAPKNHMAPHILTVNAYNDVVLAKVRDHRVTRTYQAYHEIIRTGKTTDLLTQSDAEYYTKGGLANSVLELYIGMPVMLLRNVFPSKKLFNGSILYVECMHNNEIALRPVTGPLSDQTISLPRFRFEFVVGTVKVNRFQFPLAPAFSCSISKSQGQTIDSTILDLSSSCFLHGQLYVALSRCRDETNIIVVSSLKKQVSIVYRELLRRARLL